MTVTVAVTVTVLADSFETLPEEIVGIAAALKVVFESPGIKALVSLPVVLLSKDQQSL